MMYNMASSDLIQEIQREDSEVAIGPLVHIGLHKTGSSLLQRALFSESELGFLQPTNKAELLNNAFVLRDPGESTEPAAMEELYRWRDQAKAQGKVLALSHERLSGYPASGGYDQLDIASRIRGAFPNAQVLIVIREQRSVLLSMYLQSISDGSSLPLKRFLSPPEPHIRRQPGFRFSFYEYDKLIQHYISLFGRDQVKVLPYEWLTVCPDKFAQELLHFSGTRSSEEMSALDVLNTPMNPSLPVAFQLLRRHANLIFRTQLSNFGVINVSSTTLHSMVKKIRGLTTPLHVFDKPLKQRYKALITDRTAGKYAASNAATSDLIGIDLGELGYDLES